MRLSLCALLIFTLAACGPRSIDKGETSETDPQLNDVGMEIYIGDDQPDPFGLCVEPEFHLPPCTPDDPANGPLETFLVPMGDGSVAIVDTHTCVVVGTLQLL